MLHSGKVLELEWLQTCPSCAMRAAARLAQGGIAGALVQSAGVGNSPPASPKMISPARIEDRLRVFNVPSAPGIARYHAMNDADMGVRTCTTWVK